MATIGLINGPNLNRLGSRQPDLYGQTDLPTLVKRCGDYVAPRHQLVNFQHNAEHALIDKIHQWADEKVACLVINPAAYTHTSIALRDALLAVDLPFIELHLSNIYARETYRQHSYFSDIALGVISGFGSLGYTLAMEAALQVVERKL